MSLRWTCTLLCVLLAFTTCVLGQTAAIPAVVTAAPAVGTPRPTVAAFSVPVPPVTPNVGLPAGTGTGTGTVPISTDAPHVQAVNVAKMYSDDYDEDEEADDDLPLGPTSQPVPFQPSNQPRPVTVTVRQERSIDERIAEQKYKIEQLKELLKKQREKHIATAQLIAQRNKEIQKRMKKHAAEMAKAADIQRRRDALTRAERAEKARKAAAKRAAEIRAKQRVYQLQKQLAQQHQASALAQRALIRQQEEDAVRQRIMSSQHATYEQLEAELQAHEKEWANRKKIKSFKPKIKKISTRNKLNILKNTIKTPKPIVSKSKPVSRTPTLSRRVTITPKLQFNPFARVTPNPAWYPRRRLLTPRIRRWLIIRIIRTRRTLPSPKKLPSISIARRQYFQARAKARTTLRTILQKRQCKRSEARRSFGQLSRQLAITAALAQQALIRAKSQTPKFNISTKVPTRIKRRPIIIKRRPTRVRRSIINRRPIRPRSSRRIKPRRIRRLPPTFAFKLSETPYPDLVSTRDATSSAPRTAKLAEIQQEVTNNIQNKEE